MSNVIWDDDEEVPKNFTGIMRYKLSPVFITYIDDGICIFTINTSKKQQIVWTKHNFPEYFNVVVAFMLGNMNG